MSAVKMRTPICSASVPASRVTAGRRAGEAQGGRRRQRGDTHARVSDQGATWCITAGKGRSSDARACIGGRRGRCCGTVHIPRVRAASPPLQTKHTCCPWCCRRPPPRSTLPPARHPRTRDVEGQDDAKLLGSALNHRVGTHHVLLVDGPDVDAGHRDLRVRGVVQGARGHGLSVVRMRTARANTRDAGSSSRSPHSAQRRRRCSP